MWIGLLCAFFVVGLPVRIAQPLVFASPGTEPSEAQPPDFPYWDHITQRRYEGPTVLYLGAGYAMTARHVGMGEVMLNGEITPPVAGSKRTLLNYNGSAADAMIFALDVDAESDEFALLPIAREPVVPGEELLVIGFGKGREKVVEFEIDGRREYGFTWSSKGKKRWGTNRADSNAETLTQTQFRTQSISFDFDEPFAPDSTRYEAQAAIGDSGGAVFVNREGEWLLVGMMISVSGRSRDAEISTVYGDITYSVDLTHYRQQILRWTRPACSNGLDDDGDDRIDFPFDPDCQHLNDRDERGDRGAFWNQPWALGASFLALLVGTFLWRRRSGPELAGE